MLVIYFLFNTMSPFLELISHWKSLGPYSTIFLIMNSIYLRCISIQVSDDKEYLFYLLILLIV